MSNKRVAILIYPNLCTFEFSCAIELFALHRPDFKNWYQTDVVSIQAEPVTAIGGLKVSCDHIFSKNDGFKNYDMVVIAGWSGIDIDVPKELIFALQQFHDTGGTLVSFCSGAFVLASTGLLDNKTATTHWRYQNDFKDKFPKINFQDNVLYSKEERIYTSAGSASALDLGLYIIRNDYGAKLSNEVAKRLVISPQREGGQAQFAKQQSLIDKPNHLTICMQWALDNLDQTITINQMANRACLSRRSFDRHFRNRLGISPKEWLTRQRIGLAQELLESSHLSIEHIAMQCGFGSSLNLQHHFRKILTISPSQYRRQFLKV